MLECVINISEGRDRGLLRELADTVRSSLLDVHADAFHHRSVFTLAGPDVERDARVLTTAALAALRLDRHQGVHPRLGVVDVVPFVPLETPMEQAVSARDAFSAWASETHHVPTFSYGPGTVGPDLTQSRTLPDVRKGAFRGIEPDHHVIRNDQAGAIAVGARPVLVAYNLWLRGADLNEGRRIAKHIRQPGLRTLGLQVGADVQVSCNLIDPYALGPSAAYDLVAEQWPIARAELVGLIPAAVLETEEQERWTQLDLNPTKTIEARLRRGGLQQREDLWW